MKINKNVVKVIATSIALANIAINSFANNIDTENKYSNEIMGELIISYINNNYKSASLEDLAWQLNKPISTLSRNIRTMTGCKFNELVKRKRFQQAAILLVETDMSIMEIMNSVGYENSSYFYNEFRQRYDLSPKDYRKKNKDSDKIQI